MNKSKFKIVCPDDLLKKIEEHCFSQTRTEVGGFLVGEIKDDQSIVTHIIKAKHTVAQMTQLTFTHKTWDAAFAEKDKIKPDAELIGWFHSHPNFGVFLSDHDKFIQTQFFAQDGKVTIVVDPIKGKRGWFISQDKEVIAYAKEEDTFIEKLGLSDSDSDENMMVVSSSNKGTGIGLSKVTGLFHSLKTQIHQTQRLLSPPQHQIRLGLKLRSHLPHPPSHLHHPKVRWFATRVLK